MKKLNMNMNDRNMSSLIFLLHIVSFFDLLRQRAHIMTPLFSVMHSLQK